MDRKPLTDSRIKSLKPIAGKRAELFDGDPRYPGLSIRANADWR